MKHPRITGAVLAVVTLAAATACGSSDEPAAAPAPTSAPMSMSMPMSSAAGAAPMDHPTDKLTPLLQQPLPDVPGKTFTSAVVDFAPGAKGVPHRHGQAFIYAYVLEGTLRSQLEGQPVTTYHQGQGWLEPPGSHHVLAENTSTTQPAKLLTITVSNTGDALKTDDPH
ncbi:cupin domain-containing protein [Amycolatopsis rhabdoformis]|uniref:Cupin domain-containing protein n=1 Tax=Amycolatopsis rhabdoformis TaxID=1448059 RepID=A0ABZ1ID56_9PSEU|nr:cupin domain-containing protein [Amycolatopsis rhabdoformis]WSE32083.1 cupin domain-containing protein [Amycolatopsis rhabdoformis]